MKRIALRLALVTGIVAGAAAGCRKDIHEAKAPTPPASAAAMSFPTR